jgi:hypothetical protein
MGAWVRVLVLVVIGIVGAWAGYWIGHALGWTTNAEFPLRIGGGERAILLSMGLSFLSVISGLWVVARPLVGIRRLLATGKPGHATVRRVWRTGVRMSRPDRAARELGFELEVHPEAGEDYTAIALGVIDELDEPALKPGVEVAVRYDPSNPSRVAVVGPRIPSGG